MGKHGDGIKHFDGVAVDGESEWSDAGDAPAGGATLVVPDHATTAGLQRGSSNERSFCRRRGAQLALLGIVLAALSAFTVVVFLRNSGSQGFPLPEKFSATVVAYAKLPNGTLLRDEPLFTGEVHRDGDVMRALAEIASAAGIQRHKFTAVDEVAAYQVFGSNDVVDEAEDEGVEDGEQPERVACVLPGDSPSVDDIGDSLKNAFEVTEAEMLQMVGPGGCEGDVTRYVAEMGGVTAVACMVDNLKFELVTEHHVAYADATTEVNEASMAAIEMPKALDGSALECPSLSGAVVGAAGSLGLSRRLSMSTVDCIANAANNPLLGECADVTANKEPCKKGAERVFEFTGWFWGQCIPKDCKSKDYEKRAEGELRLCLPMASRRLGATHAEGTINLRKVVPAEDRIRKCKAKGRTPTKRCVFVHGAGAPAPTNEFGSAYTRSFPWYWGPVHHYVNNFCTDVRFIRLPTADNAWDEPSLGRHFCYWATHGRPRDINDASFGEVTDTVLFVHGAGNLIVAKALNDGLCSLGDSTNWFEVNDGEDLSRMAKWNREFCEEAGHNPDGADLDAKLDAAAAKRHEFMGDGAPRTWLSDSDRKAWRAWRRDWRATFTAEEWAALKKRQQQRKLVKTLGVCKTLESAPMSFGLSRFTFDQNAAWLSLSQSAEAGSFSSRVTSAELSTLAGIINKRVSGSMCSILPDNARHRATFHAVKPTVWTNQYEEYEQRWSRCWSASGSDVFQYNPRYNSYFAITSFYEATCRFGNPMGEPHNGVNRPCDWFAQMACTHATTSNGNAPEINTGDVVVITDDDFVTDEEQAAADEDAATATP